MLCKIHNIEMDKIVAQKPVEDDNGNWVYDKDKNPLMEDASYYICQECEREQYELNYAEVGPKAEEILNKEIKEYESANPNFNPHKVNGDLIGDLMKYHENTDADVNPRKSMALYQISTNLINAISANSKGKILPNLGFFWSEPSGSNKTPLLSSGIDDFESVYKKDIYKIFNTGTAKGMMKSLAREYKIDPKKKINAMINWDEAQNIMTMMKEQSLNDIFIFMTQLIDNNIQSYTTVARDEEKYPPLTGNIWLSGVPEMIENTQKNFWFQGVGNRFLFVKSKKIQIKDIKENEDGEKDKLKEYLINELNLLHNIKMIKYTNEFLEEYNKYRKQIMNDIIDIQTNFSSSQDLDNYDVLSKIKYPVLVWKLSIIHAVSRGNFDNELAIMDVQDLQEAIKDLEEYHDNAMVVYNYWLERFIKDFEIKSSQRLMNKFKKTIAHILLESENRFDVYMENNISQVRKSEDGKYVSRSKLIHDTNMVLTEFEEAIETLKAQNYLREEEVKVGNKIAKFYTWKN